MNQASNSLLLSRVQLKDRAKGILAGKYGKCILAFLTVSVLTVAVQAAIEFIASMFLSSFIIIKEYCVNHVPLEQIELLVASPEYMQGYMEWFRIIDYILLALSSVFTTVFKVGIAYFFLNIACGHTARVSDVFYGFRNQFGKCLKLSVVFVLLGQLIDIPTTIINYLVMDATLSTKKMLLLFLVLVAALIVYTFLYIGISQIFFLVLDFPGYSAKELISLSIRIMKGHKRRLFLLELSFIPLIVLSLFTLGIGNLWLNPYMQLTYTLFFLNLMQTRKS